MFVELNLTNFRNYQFERIEFGKGLNIFLGQNGQGKTNILEAIHIVLTGDSFRYCENENLIRIEQKSEQVFPTIIHSKLISADLEFQIAVEIGKSRKTHYLNKKKISVNQIVEKFPVVLFSPESLSSIKEGADQRRKLIDDLVIFLFPAKYGLLQDFRKALRSRNKLLKDYSSDQGSKSEILSTLDSLNPIYLKLAKDLTLARLDALDKIHSDLETTMRSITQSHVDVFVDYLVSDQQVNKKTDSEIEKILKDRMIQLKNAELSSGTSLVGPHKHDIKFLYNQNDSRFFCSQGQQRALILSFKMAQIVYHRRVHKSDPILLLDDVLSELDQQKQMALIQFVKEVDSQIFVTSTDLSIPELMMSSGLKVFNVSNGRIS